METMSYTFVPSFISMRGTVSKFEEKIFEHVYQVSSPCVLPLVSLRSEEVILPEDICCCSNKVVVFEMMLHACVPSFISMRGTVSMFEE